MRTIEIHPEASRELEEARAWYEISREGLGTQFVDEVDRAMEAIQESPETWSNYIEGARRFFLHRFPYAVIYRYDERKIQVLALMHLHRKPGFWKERLK